jgi:ATP-binding cassette subfamily C (CFTR/MRP) protein 1
VGSGYIAAVIPLLVGVIYCIQKFYLRTSRQLRLLDLEHKSPVYSFFTETIEGLATIRAFKWNRTFIERFHGRLDDSQRPVYFLYLIQQWLNLVLNLIVGFLAILLVAFATQFRNSSSGPALGLALLNILSFSQSLGQLVFFYTGLETSLGAIQRIKEYSKLVPEDPPGKTQQPPDEWPSKGAVRFDDVSAAYK